MADFEFTRDYRKLWKEAKEKKSIVRMDEIFEQLCNEAEIPDPTGNASQIASGKALAELMNARDRGEGGKIQR